MAWNVFLIIVGVATLWGGGEMLVRGAVSLARTLGVSPMVVGLTVVAYATSAPEMVVGVMASTRGNPAICGGNIVGSNILNILLVLGVTALISPLHTTASFLRREIPIMVGISLLFPILVWDGHLSRWEAGTLVLLLVVYTMLAVRIARSERRQSAQNNHDGQTPDQRRPILVNLLFLLVGLGLLSGGAELFLLGAVGIARLWGVSETIIGLTLVAFGTSIPELVASVVAAVRRHSDICLGNIIGSNIYNLAAIGGVSGLIIPLPFDSEMRHIHIPVMIGSAVLLWGLIVRRLQLQRRDGAILFGCYAAYLGWTIWNQLAIH